jgi:hypothetical protein
MHFDVLSGLLGKSFTSKEFKAFHAGLGNQHEFIQIGSKADGFRSLPEMGIALEHCKSKIEGLEFYFDGFNGPSEPYEHWKGYVGELPHGVTIDDTRSSVLEKFGGTPIRAGKQPSPGEHTKLEWDEYAYSDFLLLFSFANGKLMFLKVSRHSKY